MSEMKDSGIVWIGEIPEDWTFTKISALYSLRADKVSDKDYPPLSVTMKGIVPQLETAAKSNDGDNRKLVKKGDFVINSRSDRRGSCGISSYDGSVSLINTVLTPRRNMNPRYYNWLFHSSLFSDEFYRWGHGIVDDLWTTNWQDMKKITLPVPPLSEQQRIADYLNRKCSEINTLIADIEKQIETLEQYKRSVITEAVTKGLNPDVEMKDSGIDWIGKIPKEWEIVKLKYLVKSENTNGFFDPDVDKYIGLENVKSYNNNLIETNTIYECSVQSVCRKNNVMFGKLRPYLAKVIIAPFDGFCTSEFLQLNYFEGEKNFLYYSLLNECFIDYINSSTYGTKMPRVSTDFILNTYITFPCISEQNHIAYYLDCKCEEIDGIIEDKQQQLAMLDEYKKTIIYEYVTGKKEVSVK